MTNLPLLRGILPQDSNELAKKSRNSAFKSSCLSQVASSSVWWLHWTLHILVVLFLVTLLDVSKTFTRYSWYARHHD
jgi:hypothetical protein